MSATVAPPRQAPRRLGRWTPARLALVGLAGTGALAAIARLPFLGAGLGPDEGGYAYVARQWARGAQLYQDIWIDRPQGLLSVYRAVIAVADHPWGFRLTALVFGVAITLLVGAIGWMLRGPATGVACAAIFAVAGAGPHIEGFTLNGELVAALPATAAVAAALLWFRGGRRRWLVAAGLLGGTAITMKQGGFDGLAAAAALAVAARAPWRARARSVLLVAAGAVVPLGAAMIHGLSVGFGTYWSDIVASRIASEWRDGSRSHFFSDSLPYARQDVLVLAVVALFGMLAVVVARRRTERVLLLTWLLAGIVAFNIGGLFWAHYYVQLLPALAVLAGIGATAFRSVPLAAALCSAAVAPVAVSLVGIASGADGHPIRYEKLNGLDRSVAAFVRANSAPGDTIYALDSRADLYYLADRRTGYPYLWHHSPVMTRDGRALLRLHLTGPSRPRILVMFRNPNHFDRSRALSVVVHLGYRLAWRPKAGVRVLVSRPGRFGELLGATRSPGATRAGAGR